MVQEFPHLNRVTMNVDNSGNLHTFISGYLERDVFDQDGLPSQKTNKLIFRYYNNTENMNESVL